MKTKGVKGKEKMVVGSRMECEGMGKGMMVDLGRGKGMVRKREARRTMRNSES